MRPETKDHLLGIFLAVLDGRDPRHHVIALDGDECRDGHRVLRECDRLIRAQWVLMGSPEQESAA